MDHARRCRAIALLCRQQAALHPEQSWKWLGQAERWEHLADADSTGSIPRNSYNTSGSAAA